MQRDGSKVNLVKDVWDRTFREGRDLRLELSSEGRYALRALLYLAWVGERVTADRISAEAKVPRRLLARILANLSRAGLVESEQGRAGGSRLARSAQEITLRDAVEAGAHGLWVAFKLLGYLGRAKSLPAQRDDPGSHDPVTGSLAATGQSMGLLLFFSIYRFAGAQQFRHGLLLCQSAVGLRADLYRL